MEFKWILKIYELYIKTFFHDNIILKWVLKILLGLIVFALVGEALLVLFALLISAYCKWTGYCDDVKGLNKKKRKIKVKIIELEKEEIDFLRLIDRREIIEEVYYMENSELKLKEEYYDIDNFLPEELEETIERLKDDFEKGAKIIGAFDKGQIIGMASLKNKFIGEKKDTLQMDILYVSYYYRKMGIGKKLFEGIKKLAIEKAAKKLYISSTQSKNTVDFYMNNGCKLVKFPDKELFEKEPLDIHLELELEN